MKLSPINALVTTRPSPNPTTPAITEKHEFNRDINSVREGVAGVNVNLKNNKGQTLQLIKDRGLQDVLLRHKEELKEHDDLNPAMPPPLLRDLKYKLLTTTNPAWDPIGDLQPIDRQLQCGRIVETMDMREFLEKKVE
ncbi:MAG: hypothetical protein AB8B66_01290 [Rickettsiaceae bacterium]